MASMTGNTTVTSSVPKFTPEEKADIANAIDRAIAGDMVTASRQKDEGVKAALQEKIKRLQALFIKVRQDL